MLLESPKTYKRAQNQLKLAVLIRYVRQIWSVKNAIQYVKLFDQHFIDCNYIYMGIWPDNKIRQNVEIYD